MAVSSIAMTWDLSPLPPFRFSRPRDVGVTLYLLLVASWFAMQLPIQVLAPVFFADPAGAVVGKYFSRNHPKLNPAWYQKKSVLGSLAVFLFTFATISYPVTLGARLCLAGLALLAEALGGDYDNLALAAVVLGGWVLAAQ